jgi:hypothetical protein
MNKLRVRNEWTNTARDKTIAAIKNGQTDEAIEGVEAIWAEGRPIHDLYGDMTAAFLDFIEAELGEQAVEKAWRYLGETLWKPIFTELAKAGPETLASTYAMFLRSHGYDFRAEEDDEKYIFYLDYCPSGQRLMAEGKLEGDDRHPLNFGTSKKAYSWTFDRQGVPYYCTHTQLWFAEQPKEWGLPLIRSVFGEFDNEGRVTGTPCMTYIYKTIPEGDKTESSA